MIAIKELIAKKGEKTVFIPSYAKKPEMKKAILTLDGKNILTAETTTCLIAHPGQGKSSNCEAIIKSFIMKGVDTLGYQVSEDVKFILYIDFERPHDQIWEKYYNLCDESKLELDNEKIMYVSLRTLNSAKLRIELIDEILFCIKNVDLLIIDGIGDLVNDQLDTKEADFVKNWLRKITTDNCVSVFTTLHPNRGSSNPRGHIGSMILRESQCVLNIEGKGNIKTITTENGKNSNGGEIKSSYQWDDEKSCFVKSSLHFNLEQQKPENLLTPNDWRNLLNKIDFSDGLSKEKLTNQLKEQIEENYPNAYNGKNIIANTINFMVSEKLISTTKKGKFSKFFKC
jgi:hypothetical protein